MAEPPEKKAKMSETLDKYVEDMKNSNKNLKPILDDIYVKPVPTVEAWVGRIKDMKQCSKILEILNQKLPLHGLGHLKRVFRNCVIICPFNYEMFSKAQCEIHSFCDVFIPELKDAFEYIKDVYIPAAAPLTKKQNSLCRFKWATNFHPNPQYEALFSDTVFPPKELQIHRTYMAMAFEMARIYLLRTNPVPKVEDVITWEVTTAVIVDPMINSVVALGLCNRRFNPSQHAAMVAIDNVAKTQNGGAWIDLDQEFEARFNNVEENVKTRFPTVKFGARTYVSKKDNGDPDLVEKSPYLCTGYDIYLIKEPCIMCAMGLVHARIKRIFYANENEKLGGVNSKVKMHCVKDLNHKYQVFTGF